MTQPLTDIRRRLVVRAARRGGRRPPKLLAFITATVLLVSACSSVGSTTSAATSAGAKATAAPSSASATSSLAANTNAGSATTSRPILSSSSQSSAAAGATASSATSATTTAASSVGSARTTSAVTPVRATSATTTVAGQSDNWLTYHRTADRAGFDAASAPFQAIKSLWRSPTLDGDIYAEPLLDGARLLIVTENNTVYSLDAATGHVQWRQHLGTPVPRSELPCGDINPTGITGTPVIDAASNTLYAVTFTQPGQHNLVAIDLTTGAARYRVSIDPAGANPIVQQQRAALALNNGTVYVSYGGLDGDCGQYHGWIVAASAATGAVTAEYQVPTQREGAIWSPAGPAIDSAGNLYVATGNGSSTGRFDFGDSVIKLSPDLKVLDWFAPTNWAQLNGADLDLGSLSPLLLPNNLIFQIGKSGEGYLLQANHLGQIGGQVFAAPVCAGGYGAFGSDAYAAPYIYVPCRNGLVAVKPNGPTFSVAWTASSFAPDSPVVAGGGVWVVNPARNDLVGLDATSGVVRFTAALPAAPNGLPHFITPTVANGVIYVAAGQTVAAFR